MINQLIRYPVIAARGRRLNRAPKHSILIIDAYVTIINVIIL